MSARSDRALGHGGGPVLLTPAGVHQTSPDPSHPAAGTVAFCRRIGREYQDPGTSTGTPYHPKRDCRWPHPARARARRVAPRLDGGRRRWPAAASRAGGRGGARCPAAGESPSTATSSPTWRSGWRSRCGVPPAEIAAALVAALSETAAADPGSPIADASVAGPGFVNLRVTDAALARRVDRGTAPIPRPGAACRSPTRTAARHVNVEFVSANPTGPLTVGNARGAFVGDLLARVLEAGGQRVTREYYFNDSGAQVRNLGASVLAIREGREIPEDGYHGDYVADLAPELPGRARDAAHRPGRRRAERPGALGIRRRSVGVGSDPDGHRGVARAARRALRRLDDRGEPARQRLGRPGDGEAARRRPPVRAGRRAWFRSTAFGDDKDRVLVRSNGSRTYFAADIGYVLEKFSRGFDHLIYIWGADHHGTVARLRNAAEAMGLDKSRGRGHPHRLGALPPGRPGAVDVQARRDVHRARRPAGRARRRRGALVLREPRREREHGRRHRAREAAVEREPGLLRAVRPRPDRLDPAQGGRDRAGRGTVGRRGRSAASPKARWRESSRACPRSSRTPLRRRRRRASRRMRPSWRRRSTPSIATRGSWIPMSPSARRSAWPSSMRRESRSRTPSRCWGSPRPRSM